MNMLVLKGETFSLQSWLLKQRCELFATSPALLDSPYHVKSQVGLDVFRLFLEAIKGTSATITNQSFAELSELCSEFVFNGLANELSAFRASPGFQDAQTADKRIRDLEDQISLLITQTAKYEERIAALEGVVNSQVPKHEETITVHSAAVE
jgi:hypothetical protein